ncbi:MAG: hypothetical protein JO157_00725 [Acetobacteraceae bacterium]|nr:hypothetical protein [Acetobacteraceae bacterium]
MDSTGGRAYMLGPMKPNRTVRTVALALLAGAIAPVLAPAFAEEQRPPTLPSRDVAVTYQVTGVAADALPGGAPGDLQLAWDAAGRRLHISAQGQPQAAIVDLAEGKAEILDAGSHTALILPLGKRVTGSMTLSGARFRRDGTERVAGQDCTDYAVQAPHGSGTLCITSDGVPLRGDGTWDGEAGRFVATRVDYGPQPDALFETPPGFMKLSLPKSLGTMGTTR